MLRRRDQLLSVMAKEVCQAREEVLTIVNTSWEPTDCRGCASALAPGSASAPSSTATPWSTSPHRDWVAALDDHRGFEVRVVDRVDTLYLLVDRYVVFLNLTVPGSESPGSHAESLLMRHAGLAQTLHDAFERTWRHGVPLSRPSRRTAHPPLWAQRPARATPPRPGGSGRAPATAARPDG